MRTETELRMKSIGQVNGLSAQWLKLSLLLFAAVLLLLLLLWLVIALSLTPQTPMGQATMENERRKKRNQYLPQPLDQPSFDKGVLESMWGKPQRFKRKSSNFRAVSTPPLALVTPCPKCRLA